MTLAAAVPPLRQPEVEAVDFYWRPACVFCSSLRRGLERRGIALRPHDIWSDPDAAAVVRAAARGHETVPTVGIADEMLVNPRIVDVLDTLERVAPHLVSLPPPQAIKHRRLPASSVGPPDDRAHSRGMTNG